MPKWTKLVAGWALAATIALAFSWGAVAQVRNRVIQASVEIPSAPTAALSNQTTTSAPSVIRLDPEPIDSSTSTNQVTETTSVTTPGTTPKTTIPTSSSTPTTTIPSSSSTTNPSATTTTTAAAPPQTQTSSYSLVGGVVTVSYSPGVVTFISAIPQPGFSADPRNKGPDEVRIRFESANHTSDFRAEWEGNELKITKNESGD